MRITIRKRIIPDKLICNSIFYLISLTNFSYIINEFIIYTDENKRIEKIIITKGNHPNCDPENKEFCIPDFIKKIDKINNETLQIIENMFKIFNFDSAFYQPWEDFTMKREEKMYD
jgi:hypothetical protein